jgi:enoyl-CoA hydratase/carnithine racemase
MPYEHIRTRVGSSIGLLTLSRPLRQNALTIKMRQEIVDCLDKWRDDRSVSVVIFRGEGGVFCSGIDREELLSLDPDVRKGVYESSKTYHRAVAYFPKPTVAAIEGFAFGAGFDLSLLCDVRIAVEGASFGHPEVKIGAPPLFTPLRLIVGEGWARDLCLTGRRIYAADALRIGLVTYVVGPEDLTAFADTIGRRVAEAPIETLRLTKSFFLGAPGSLLEECLVREHDEPFQSTYALGAPKGETQPG